MGRVSVSRFNSLWIDDVSGGVVCACVNVAVLREP
jgi:hypothetical protein